MCQVHAKNHAIGFSPCWVSANGPIAQGSDRRMFHWVKLPDRIFARHPRHIPLTQMNLSASLRKGENFHIVLWLVKDMCWVMDQKILGTIMIAPTLLMAIWIAYRSREDMGELLHSLAVVLWITANGTWMLGEFYFMDGTRGLALPLFIAGLVCVAFYYLVWAPREASRKRRAEHDRTA